MWGPTATTTLHPYADITLGAGWNVHSGQSYSVDRNSAAMGGLGASARPLTPIHPCGSQ